MPRRIQEKELQAIEAALAQHVEGLTAQQIHDALAAPPPRRTLQYRLKHLVDGKRLHRAGAGRWARYLPPRPGPERSTDTRASARNEIRRRAAPPGTPAAERIQQYVNQPLDRRRAAGYNPASLKAYRPNETFYLSREQRENLLDIGTVRATGKSAKGYPDRITKRLLTDLSWNSSRLEGNSYSLLETELLIKAGEAAEGRRLRETQMILNHKASIEYLASGPKEIGFNRPTLLGLHALLTDNLLANPEAAGRLRRAPARIAGSVYTPPAESVQIEAGFERLLAAASEIKDPFEQSFFVLVQIAYLQPFDDANSRVARLAANIPLIKANLAPLTFEGVPRDIYNQAVLGFNELRRRQFLAEVFVYAYQRSAGHYGAVRHLSGEPDPLRWKHQTALRHVIGGVIRGCLRKSQAVAHIRSWSQQHIESNERTSLRDIAERELLSLHAGNCARYRIHPCEFASWRRNWTGQGA